jgi:hypothetical protein
MAGKRMSVAKLEEIKRMIDQGLTDREIARSLKCRRLKVAGVRKGVIKIPEVQVADGLALWTYQVNWDEVLKEVGLKHPMKFIWEEKALGLTSYPNFFKTFYLKFPHIKAGTITLRDFEPGERAEVDWAGGKIEWMDLKTGEIKESLIFIGILGYSQLIFATAMDNMKSRQFLHSHKLMYEAFGGVPLVTAPDCTKTAVSKCHLYDPDLNPNYTEMARHYGTAIVPARPHRPKDKALVEGAVKIVMRLMKWRYRRHTFTSLAEIRKALTETVGLINIKTHTRFRVSRLDRFDKLEKTALKELPTAAFEAIDTKDVILHPDSTVLLEHVYYSAPHRFRGKLLRARLSENLVELFFEAERVAAHPRSRCQDGRRIINNDHLPENSKAYREATPQNILNQAKFISPNLNLLIAELFEKDTMGKLRLAMGLITTASKELRENPLQRERVLFAIDEAITTMKRFNKIRVANFKALIVDFKKKAVPPENRDIVRRPGNPMLRLQTEFAINQ